MESEIKFLKIAESHRFEADRLYLNKDGSVNYKFTDGPKFKSVEAIKKSYKKHFGRNPRIIQ